MRSKKFTITKTNINLGEEVETDVTIKREVSTGDTLYPDSIIIYNVDGATIEYTILSAEEKADRVKYSQNYTLIPLPSGETVVNTPQKISYLILKKVNGTLNSSIIVYGVNYV